MSGRGQIYGGSVRELKASRNSGFLRRRRNVYDDEQARMPDL